MYKTIGFFGDSFCAEISNHHSILYNYESYIKKLEKHYNIKIVNLGIGGSSVWDTLLLQLDPFIKSNTIPDICVFVWTTNGRLFHRKIRKLSSTYSVKDIPQSNIYNATKMYYDYLIDWEKDQIEWEAALRYIDQVVLTKIPQKIKIIHLWTSGKPVKWTKEGFLSSIYPYVFQRGSEIRPNLTVVSLYDKEISILKNDQRCNHLDGNTKNSIVFNWIKTAIDNSDKLWDYNNEISNPESKFFLA